MRTSYTSGTSYTNADCNLFADAVAIFQNQRSPYIELSMEVSSEYRNKVNEMLWDKGVDRGRALWISANAVAFSEGNLTAFVEDQIAHKWALSSCSWQLGKQY